MITECPHCGNEYEIELDQSVGEITIRCPKCRVPFTINNQQKRPTLVNVSEVVPIKKKSNWMMGFLKGFLYVMIGLFAVGLIVKVAHEGIQDETSDIEPSMRFLRKRG